jgi:hypothetical protein
MALVHVPRQGLEGDALQIGGHVAGQLARGVDVHVADLLEGGEIRGPHEEALPREQLVEDDAGREDVAAPVERQAAHLLGGHVAELALQHARVGLAGLGGRLGHAEVDELHLARGGHQDVLRGHVAMHEPQGLPLGIAPVVRMVQALAHFHHDVAGQGRRHALAALAHPLQNRPHVLAVDVLHGEERGLPHLPQLQDGHDVGVMELLGDARLVEEHLHELRIAGDGRQDALDGHEAARAGVVDALGLEHLGHAALGGALEQQVAPEAHGALRRGHSSTPPSV